VGWNAHVPDPEIHHVRRDAGTGSLRKRRSAERRQAESGQRRSQKKSSTIRLSSRVSFRRTGYHTISVSFTEYGVGPRRVSGNCPEAIGSALHGESRRAILVGIDEYNPDPDTQAQLLRDLHPPTLKRPAVEGDARYWRFANLDGAVNDVHLMQAVLQDIGFQDFVVLTDRDATADAILQTLQKNLVDERPAGRRAPLLLFRPRQPREEPRQLRTAAGRSDDGAGRQLAQRPRHPR